MADLYLVVHNGVFKTLKPYKKIAQVVLDEELETIAWLGGLDFAPEFVYFQVLKDVPQYQSQFKAWGCNS